MKIKRCVNAKSETSLNAQTQCVHKKTDLKLMHLILLPLASTQYCILLLTGPEISFDLVICLKSSTF